MGLGYSNLVWSGLVGFGLVDDIHSYTAILESRCRVSRIASRLHIRV